MILVPVLTSLFLLARQAALFLDWVRIQPLLGPDEMQRFWEELPRRYPGLKNWIAFLQAQIAPLVSGGISQVAGGANGLLQNVLTRVTHAAIDLGMFLLMLFFLLRDGGRLKAELRPISPFSAEQEQPDLRAPRAHHQGRAAGRGGGAGDPGHPRRDRLLHVRRALAARVGHGRDPRGDGPARGLAARLAAGVRLPAGAGRDGPRARAARLSARSS